MTWNGLSNFNRQKQPPQVFLKLSVLKNLSNFTGRHLCWSLIVIKLQDWKPSACNFIKKRLQHRCFLVNIVEFSKKPFFIENLWWLLLLLLTESEIHLCLYTFDAYATFTKLFRAAFLQNIFGRVEGYAFIARKLIKFPLWKLAEYFIFCFSFFLFYIV